ncbi:MAG: DNA pilot protein [Microviridae sp.]|nr:MAG: DNA pilot protein [Microviridae sp.]
MANKRIKGVTYFTQPSLTKQAFKDSCDMNLILKRFLECGQVPPVAPPPKFLDVMDITYHEAVNYVLDAQDYFDTMPSRLRDAYSNDPEKFIDALGDPEKHARLVELGYPSPLKPITSVDLGFKGGSEEPTAEKEVFDTPAKVKSEAGA